MKQRNEFVKLAAAAMLVATTFATTATAQDDSKISQEAVPQANESCFYEGEKIVDNLPKHEPSKREQQILDKTIRVINRFESQKHAFSKLDQDNNCKLDRSEINRLLSYAKINGFTRAIASGRLISRYDLSNDGFVQWREFHFAVEKALAKQAAKELADEAAKQLAEESVKTSFR